MSKNSRVVKFRRRKTINIGVVIFLILFIYIAINIYIYLTKKHISIYEVQEGFNVEDSRITGLILRDEHLVTADKAGYVYYFQKEGGRVSKGASVCSIDESTQIMDIITSNDDIITLSDDENVQLQYLIKRFHNNYSDYNFSCIYDFKSDIESVTYDILNQAMIEKGRQIEEDTGYAYTYEVCRSKSSGIISYYMDNYETVTKDSISKDLFNTENYKRISLRTSDMVSVNTPIYKLITSETWSIILPLNEEQYAKLSDKEKIEFTILKDDFTTTAPIKLFQSAQDGAYYAEITMNSYLSNYLDDRFLDIDLHLEAVEGLKIPLSALTTKDFYLVPLTYFTTGGDSNEQGLIKEEYDKDTGEVNLVFVKTDIYYQDDTYGYIDTNLFNPNTWIRSTDGNRYQLSVTKKLIGVYNVNMGYAVFKRVEILYQNESYCIVDKNTTYGLALYDHIALDSTTVVEQKIIY